MCRFEMWQQKMVSLSLPTSLSLSELTFGIVIPQKQGQLKSGRGVLRIRNTGFTITTSDSPPRCLGTWQITHIRKFGGTGSFKFQTGTVCMISSSHSHYTHSSHMQSLTHTHTLTHTCNHPPTYTYKHLYLQTYTHTLITHTHSHTHTHTRYLSTHTHPHPPTQAPSAPRERCCTRSKQTTMLRSNLCSTICPSISRYSVTIVLVDG